MLISAKDPKKITGLLAKKSELQYLLNKAELDTEEYLEFVEDEQEKTAERKLTLSFKEQELFNSIYNPETGDPRISQMVENNIQGVQSTTEHLGFTQQEQVQILGHYVTETTEIRANFSAEGVSTIESLAAMGISEYQVKEMILIVAGNSEECHSEGMSFLQERYMNMPPCTENRRQYIEDLDININELDFEYNHELQRGIYVLEQLQLFQKTGGNTREEFEEFLDGNLQNLNEEQRSYLETYHGQALYSRYLSKIIEHRERTLEEYMNGAPEHDVCIIPANIQNELQNIQYDHVNDIGINFYPVIDGVNDRETLGIPSEQNCTDKGCSK